MVSVDLEINIDSIGLKKRIQEYLSKYQPSKFFIGKGEAAVFFLWNTLSKIKIVFTEFVWFYSSQTKVYGLILRLMKRKKYSCKKKKGRYFY